MEDGFDFWQDHSEKFLVMAYLHDRRKELEDPHGRGEKTGDCGDSVAISLRVAEKRIEEICFTLDGCLHTNACCNTVAELIEGELVEKAWQITVDEVIDYLKTLPQDHHHCAELAVGTLYLALQDYQQRQAAKT